MRIIITFQNMVAFAGTETYVLTVAGALEKLGHDVVIHTHQAGPFAEFARVHGVRVVEHEAELPTRCDAVFAQDATTAYTMARRYPDAVRVFVVHSAFPLQSPPQLEAVCHAVVVMNDRLLRRAEQFAWHPRVVRLRQPIDLQRFCFRALNLEQRSPPRVLWLNNNHAHTRQLMLERACDAVGLELCHSSETIVPAGTSEQAIASAEIVVSLGRGALEAMASGRAAYVFGVAGGDGWVTAESYNALERDGFSGRGLGQPMDLERLVSDLSSWSEEIGEVGRDLACRYHDADQHAVELLELVGQLESPTVDPSTPLDELARLTRLEWNSTAQGRQAVAETARLRAELREQHAKVAELEGALAALRATRRYRFASLIASPLDRLRARRNSRSR
jgi:hypothetical protein